MQSASMNWTVLLLYKNAAQCKAVGSFVGKSFKTGVTDIASDHFPVFLKVRLQSLHGYFKAEDTLDRK